MSRNQAVKETRKGLSGGGAGVGGEQHEQRPGGWESTLEGQKVWSLWLDFLQQLEG